MDRRQRRFLAYAGVFIGIVTAYTLAYAGVMRFVEGEPRTLLKSLLVVVETFTTLGFGTDAGAWTQPLTIGLMVAMQLTAVFFIFMALPLFVSPWLEETFSTTLPTTVTTEDHVVVCSLTDRTRTLLDELELVDMEAVVVTPDRDLAVELHEAGWTVISGDPETRETLEAANIAAARAVVADVDDEANASIALAADDSEQDGPLVITFVEEPEVAEYHRYAGADHVFSPRTLIGQSLANVATTSLEFGLGDAVEVGEELEIVELPVQANCELVGRTIAESGIRERTGVEVVGAWFRGEFVSPPSPDDVIDERTVLLVAGEERQLEELKTMTMTDERALESGPVLVCGMGEVGTTVAGAVREAGYECYTVDRNDGPGVDVVGDVTEQSTLLEAGLEKASIVVLALSTDTDAVFATLAIRQLDPDVEVIVRANAKGSVRKLYRAGGDYVLALSTISGRMLASIILGEEMLSYDQQIAVVRAPAGPFAGRTLEEADIRARTGVTVVGVERDGDLETELGPDFRLAESDDLVVAGPDDAVTNFTAVTGGARTPAD
ncbi:MAG: TrkA family potassium uptake protein [Salinirussus sp.]